MQGVGIFANSLILTFLLMVTKHRGGENGYENGGGGDDDANDNNIGYEYDQSTLLNIWRIVYATGTLVLVYLLVSRILHLTESEVWSQDRIQRTAELANRMNRENVEEGFSPPKVGPYEKEMATLDTNFGDAEPPIISPTMSSITMRSDFEGLGSTNLDGCRVVPVVMEDMICKAPGEYSVKTKPSEMTLLLQHYGVRLFGTSATWLLWDIAFYGNKLFQSSFLIAMTGEDASLVDITCASAINAFVALLGYFAAAAIIDDPDVGRLTLQQTGFIITGTLFLLCGCLSDRLSSTWLVVMYFASSFFGQCGPNCTTFLIPAEIFPTETRTMCHGISASSGKLGALLASVLFNFIGEKQLFLFSGYASFIACLITFVTIPETATLDLYEIDKQWRMILDGRKFEYEGPANDPKHLSFFERNHNKLCCRR
eukprot:g7573.t1 g7573   contig24:938059-939502(+)